MEYNKVIEIVFDYFENLNVPPSLFEQYLNEFVELYGKDKLVIQSLIKDIKTLKKLIYYKHKQQNIELKYPKNILVGNNGHGRRVLNFIFRRWRFTNWSMESKFTSLDNLFTEQNSMILHIFFQIEIWILLLENINHEKCGNITDKKYINLAGRDIIDVFDNIGIDTTLFGTKYSFLEEIEKKPTKVFDPKVVIGELNILYERIMTAYKFETGDRYGIDKCMGHNLMATYVLARWKLPNEKWWKVLSQVTKKLYYKTPISTLIQIWILFLRTLFNI